MKPRGAKTPPILLTFDSRTPATERKPPHPAAGWWLARLLLALACVLIWHIPAWSSWAATNDPHTVRGQASSAARRAALEALPPQERATAQLQDQLANPFRQAGVAILGALAHPAADRLLTGIALVGALGLLVELAIGAGRFVAHARRVPELGRLHLRVRTPRPQSRKRAAAPLPTDLWRALHTTLFELAQDSPAAYLTFTLSARPQQPATLGVTIAQGRSRPARPGQPTPRRTHGPLRAARERVRATLKLAAQPGGRRALDPVHAPASEGLTPEAQQREALRRALDKIILGQDAEAVVDGVTDPFAQPVDPARDRQLPEAERERVVQPGRLVVWQDLTLALPPHYLIRTADSFDRDMLGGLAAALRTPAGILHSEIQVAVRPRRDDGEVTPWRVLARRRLISLQRRQAVGAATEARSLEGKIAGESYDVSVRLVVVAADRRGYGGAVAMIRELRAAFGQYQVRSGAGVQRWRGADVGSMRAAVVPEPAARQSLGGLPGLLAGAASTVAGVALLAAGWGAAVAATPLLGAAPPIAATAGGALLLIAAPLGLGGRLIRRRALALALARAPRPTPPLPRLLLAPAWRGPAVLSAAEVAGLWHLPSPSLGGLVAWLPNRYLPAQPHAFIPEGARDRIVIGYARRSDGTEAPVGPALRDLRKVLHLTAGMGAGKSRALTNIAQQLIPNGMIILDGKGDDREGNLVAAVRRQIPREDEHRVILLDPLDTAWPFAIDPLSTVDLKQPAAASIALGMIMAIFAGLDPEGWDKSVGMKQYVTMGAILVLEGEPRPTLGKIRQALLDERYRTQLLERCANIDVRTFWTVVFPNTSEQQKNSLDALGRRFDALLVSELTRTMISLSWPTVDLIAAMEEGAIVLMPLPHNALGERASLISMFEFTGVVSAAFNRPGSDQTRATVPLIIDEFQAFIAEGRLEAAHVALTQLRSSGIGGVYAHQSLKQLGDLEAEMLQNSASRLILRTNEPDASVYVRQFPTTDITAADIVGQEFDEHQYAVFASGTTVAELCSIRPLLWPEPLDVDSGLPPDTGPDWRTVLPETAPETRALDEAVLGLIYGDHPAQHVQEQLARLPEGEWQAILARWDTIRAAQRRHILANPGCIPDRMERQRWLSRLGYQTARILADADYQRQRWALDPAAAAEAAPAPSEAERRERERFTVSMRAASTAPAPGLTDLSQAAGGPVVSSVRPGEIRDPLAANARERTTPRTNAVRRGRLREAGDDDFASGSPAGHPAEAGRLEQLLGRFRRRQEDDMPPSTDEQ